MRAETQQEKGKRIVLEALAALGGLKFQGMRNRVEVRAGLRLLSRTPHRPRRRPLLHQVPRSHPQGARNPGADQSASPSARKKTRSSSTTKRRKGYILTYRGAKPMPGDRNRRYRESTIRNVLYILSSRMNEEGLEFLSKGPDVIDNNPGRTRGHLRLAEPLHRRRLPPLHQAAAAADLQLYRTRSPKTASKRSRFSRSIVT